MPFISLSKLLRFNLYYWCAIFGLGLLSSWQNALIHVKEFEWRYLPTMLASEMVAMLLTAMVVVWSYRRIQQQFFANWQLLAGVALVALIYIPAENAFWMVLWDKDIIDMRMLIGNLDTSVLAFFVWAACYLTVLINQQQLAREAETSQLSQKIQQLELQALSHQLNPHFTFNALNSVCALLEAQRYDDAETMSEQLATFLRYSLSSSPDSLVKLADELAGRLGDEMTPGQDKATRRLRSVHRHVAAEIDLCHAAVLHRAGEAAGGAFGDGQGAVVE